MTQEQEKYQIKAWVTPDEYESIAEMLKVPPRIEFEIHDNGACIDDSEIGRILAHAVARRVYGENDDGEADGFLDERNFRSMRSCLGRLPSVPLS